MRGDSQTFSQISVLMFCSKRKGITFVLQKYPVVTERLREKCVAHKCRLRRTIFLPILDVFLVKLVELK